MNCPTTSQRVCSRAILRRTRSNATCIIARLQNSLVDFDDDVLLLNGDGEGVGDVGAFLGFGTGCLEVCTALDVDFVFSDAPLRWTPPRLPCFDVEFPTVPGAAENLTFTGIVIIAGTRGL